MTPYVNCPTCDRSLGRVLEDGSLKAQCPSCKTHYGAVFGKLSHWSSTLEPLFYLSPKLPRLVRRRYDFRITTPGRCIKQLRFSMLGEADQVPVHPGDRISVIYSTRGTQLEKLMAIHNHSRGRLLRMPSPIPSRRHLLETRGTVASTVILGAVLGGIDLGLMGLGAATLLLYHRLTDFAQLTTPDLQRQNPVDARLLDELKLVAQQRSLENRIAELRQDSQEIQTLSKTLHALRHKMMAVNPQLYASRVANLEAAIRLLKQRAAHNQQLIDEYAQTIQMIEIELESVSLADQLPMEDFSRQIEQRLQELRTLEAENRNLHLQLEAQEEVRRMSRGY